MPGTWSFFHMLKCRVEVHPIGDHFITVTVRTAHSDSEVVEDIVIRGRPTRWIKKDGLTLLVENVRNDVGITYRLRNISAELARLFFSG